MLYVTKYYLEIYLNRNSSSSSCKTLVTVIWSSSKNWLKYVQFNRCKISETFAQLLKILHLCRPLSSMCREQTPEIWDTVQVVWWPLTGETQQNELDHEAWPRIQAKNTSLKFKLKLSKEESKLFLYHTKCGY